MADLSFRVITPRPNARRRFDRWWFQPATPGWFGRWLLTPHPGPTIGRKRRARRARGRRIEARRKRPALLTFAQLAADHRLDALAYGLAVHQQLLRHGVMSQQEARATFLDPSLGEPWKEQADEADQDRR